MFSRRLSFSYLHRVRCIIKGGGAEALIDAEHLHHGRLQIVDGQNPILLPIHRLREETVSLFDLPLLLRRNVMFLRKLRLSRLRGRRRARWRRRRSAA